MSNNKKKAVPTGGYGSSSTGQWCSSTRGGRDSTIGAAGTPKTQSFTSIDHVNADARFCGDFFVLALPPVGSGGALLRGSVVGPGASTPAADFGGWKVGVGAFLVTASIGGTNREEQ